MGRAEHQQIRATLPPWRCHYAIWFEAREGGAGREHGVTGSGLPASAFQALQTRLQALRYDVANPRRNPFAETHVIAMTLAVPYVASNLEYELDHIRRLAASHGSVAWIQLTGRNPINALNQRPWA